MSDELYLTFDIPAAGTPVQLPILGTSVLATINWGDATIDTGVDPATTIHIYGSAASFNVVVTITRGEVTQFGLDGWSGVDYLTVVDTNNPATWGLGNSTLSLSFASLFKGAVLLTSVPTNIPSRVSNMTSMFIDASSFNQDISNWGVSNVTSMLLMFAGATSFNQDIRDWNVGLVTNMSNMFSGATAFNNGSPTDDQAHPLTWNTGNVRIMSGMFASASSFNQDISSWNTTNVTLMEGMFLGATIFNQYIGYNLGTGAWNVSNVENMKLMFFEATNFNGDISNWNVGNVRTMNSMFMFADSFSQNIGVWDVRNVMDMAYMFYGLIYFNVDISGWNVSNVTDMQFMLYNTQSFNQDITRWDVSRVTKMIAMFTTAISFNRNIRRWSVNASADLTNMFNNATAFQEAFYTDQNYPGYNPTIGNPNTPLYTFFNYSPPPPPPPPAPNASGIRGGVGGGGGAFWFGVDGFLYKRKAAGGCRRSTKMGPGGNALCNNSTYIYNKFKPGGGGVGASSIANRRAKSRLATVCNTQRCFPCYNTLGQYSNYTHNPNGFVPCPGPLK